jgi:hypothetical protein
MPPPIYISFGMCKSGSTLAFELTKALLESAGRPQPRLSDEAVEADHAINFAKVIKPKTLAAMRREAEALGTTVVVKTHHPPWNCSLNALAAGEVLAHAVARDPRDIALSLLDAGAKSRAAGTQGFSRIHSLQDACAMMRFHVKGFQAWAESPEVLPIFYEDLAFNTAAAARRIADQIGIEADVDWAVREATGARFTQLNKAQPNRHRTEMAPADAEAIGAEFAEFIDRYFPTPSTA